MEAKDLPSLYARYVREREGKETIESDIGFATYQYWDDGVYIENIYVHPDHRFSGEASRLADQIAEEARAKGFTKMYGSVSPAANFSTESLKVLLAYGFKLRSSAVNMLYMVKDI